MLKRHEIQVLRRAGHTLKEVAKLTGVSQSSVQRVEAEPAVVTLVGAEAIAWPATRAARALCTS